MILYGTPNMTLVENPILTWVEGSNREQNVLKKVKNSLFRCYSYVYKRIKQWKLTLSSSSFEVNI